MTFANADNVKPTDVYTRVTEKIIGDLEKGNLTWRKPWNSDNLAGRISLPLRSNGIPYTGINTIILWSESADKGYSLPHWLTFKQAVDLKASIQKGGKGTQVVYADKVIKEEQDEEGELAIKTFHFLKTYTVFNASQVNGLPAKFYQQPSHEDGNEHIRVSELEQFFVQTKADIYTGNQASYNQSTDRIQMPPFESFIRPIDYYSTLGHELIHWTKHSIRLDRDFGRKRFADKGYATEELVAELGSCFLGAMLGFEPIPEEQHAAYLQSWLTALQENKQFIFSVASHAQKAAEFAFMSAGRDAYQMP